ncbi:MAG TPA: hypothetical protein DCX51_04645 [Halomonas sp.]|jgi:chromosome segregation ATPase|uniref:Uncharacterized protein n=1 Tax=Vreelandella aquamarina TaxID=77097 RepID=A0A6F8SS27_9GAMM|nr:MULTISPECIES: hypothetical protein [Halomonas]KTG25229.1 hypothetical protein AUR68_21405 [Idiomarina sp. H105]MEC8900974.1 hypothetical protein [Pseudomonadota bacterium]OAE95091.1 hypothetical protein AWR38_21430 [Idiomarina sp. WRN-38]MCC4292497.1 hypothetical protein [Halomonas axialensis]MCF2911714.1 hypothetical protein [Halomonas sp. Cn5-12]|tara:strand:- start:477 stop:1088 length:612 start_codon:yes stop_codon:yes gene_type:complete
MTENTTTSLKTAAVQLDTLADPRLAAEGQSLLARLDKLAADMAKAPRKARISLLLDEHDGSVTNLLLDLRAKVEDAEKLKEAVGKEDGRLLSQRETLDNVLQSTTVALHNQKRRLTDEKLGIEQRIKQLDRERHVAIERLIDAGLTPEEAAGRAKPEKSAVNELSAKLEALPTTGENIQWRLGSYVHRLQMMEQAKTPGELTA